MFDQYDVSTCQLQAFVHVMVSRVLAQIKLYIRVS